MHKSALKETWVVSQELILGVESRSFACYPKPSVRAANKELQIMTRHDID